MNKKNILKTIFKLLGVEPYESFYLREGEEILINSEGRKAVYFLTDKLTLFKDGFPIDNGFPALICDGCFEIVKMFKEVKQIEPSKEEQVAIDYAQLCGYKWLAKDANGTVNAYINKPYKRKEEWVSSCSRSLMGIRIPISFLSWKDDAPYRIGGEEN